MLKRKRAKQTIQGATTRGERYNPEILRVRLLRGWRQVDGLHPQEYFAARSDRASFSEPVTTSH